MELLRAENVPILEGAVDWKDAIRTSPCRTRVPSRAH